MVDVLSFCVGIYSLIIAALGVIGNLLIFITTFRVKNNTTFIFLRFVSISDLVTLFFFNLDSFTLPVYDVYLENISVTACKWVDFLQFTSFQVSAWILVSLSFDRYFSVAFLNWHRLYFKTTRAIIFSWLVILIVIAINIHILFTFGNTSIELDEFNKTTVIARCYDIEEDPDQLMNYWQYVNGFLYSFIPFIMLVISNTLLVIKIYQQNRSSTALNNLNNTSERTNHVRSLTKTVMAITLLFIIMTSPISVASFWYNYLVETYVGLMILNFLNSLCITYHALNIFILLATNKKFSKELFSLIGCLVCCSFFLQRKAFNVSNDSSNQTLRQNNVARTSFKKNGNEITKTNEKVLKTKENFEQH